MAYFLVIPVFVLWLVLAGVALVGVQKIPSLEKARPYIIRGCIGAILGFLAANVALAIVLAIGAKAFVALPNKFFGRNFLEISWGLAAILGPLPASAMGWLAGALLGGFMGYKKGSRKLA